MKLLSFNKAIKILLMTNSLVLISGAMIAPIYSIFVNKIGGDLLDASLTSGIFSLIAGITTFISGKFSDSIKENELIIVIGYILTGVGFIFYIFVNSILSLFLVQIFIGFSQAFYNPAFDAVYSKHLNKHTVGKDWGAWESINYFSTAIGSAIGGLIAAYLGFQILFLLMSLLCFISALYIYFLPRNIL